MKKAHIEAMQQALKIQGYDGNWNYSESMFGMYNGMELMMSMVENRRAAFKEIPDTWLKDVESNSSPIEAENVSQ